MLQVVSTLNNRCPYLSKMSTFYHQIPVLLYLIFIYITQKDTLLCICHINAHQHAYGMRPDCALWMGSTDCHAHVQENICLYFKTQKSVLFFNYLSIHKYIYSCIYVCINIHKYSVYIYSWTYICVHIYTHIYIYIYICSVCIYTHTLFTHRDG